MLPSFCFENKSGYWTMEIMTVIYAMAIIIYMREITIDSDLLINVKV